MNKKKIIESPIKSRVRKMILEGEMENAEAALAAKDLVDRLQDMVKELSKMANEELPHLIDAIRSSFGPDAATTYQQSANSALTDLLEQVKNKKTELENATLVLTGDAPGGAPGSSLGLPSEEDGMMPEPPAEDAGIAPAGKELDAKTNPLGREHRLPTKESVKVSRRILEAKIVAINTALRETNTVKNPIKARRLAEELRRLVTEAIKQDAKKEKTNKKPIKKKPVKK